MRETQNKTRTLYDNQKLAAHMYKRGWTPSVTAQKAGISEPSVNRGLVGTLATLTKLRKLADALGVKWEDLFKNVN